MNPRDRRATLLGGGALAALAVTWLLILPWWNHWAETRRHIVQSRQRLEDIQDQTRRLIALDRQLEPVLGPSVKKPLSDVATTRTQMLKEVTEMYARAGAEVSSVQPQSPRTLQELPGVVRLTLQVQCACQPMQLVKLLSGAKSNPNLLLLDRVETSTGPQGRGSMNVTMVWSTLARQEGNGND